MDHTEELHAEFEVSSAIAISDASGRLANHDLQAENYLIGSKPHETWPDRFV